MPLIQKLGGRGRGSLYTQGSCSIGKLQDSQDKGSCLRKKQKTMNKQQRKSHVALAELEFLALIQSLLKIPI